MEISGDQEQLVGTPELAPIGKRIEMLRIERGLSKQQLAKGAGISRQQLWRVLAGKSELTSSLRERLAFVLRTDITVLQAAALEAPAPAGGAAWLVPVVGGPASATGTIRPEPRAAAPTFGEFVAQPGTVRDVLAILPACEAGLALKRAFLDAIEDVAIKRELALPAEFFELRRAVITRAI